MASKLVFVYLFTWLSCCALSSAGSACSNFPYNDLLFLSAYPPAEQFCSAHFPPTPLTVRAPAATRRVKAKDRRGKTRTTTTTTTKKVATTTTKSPSRPTTTQSHTTTKASTTTTTKGPTTTTAASGTCSGACSVWTSCTKQGGGFLSTLCRCIESTVTITTTPTTTTTTPATSCPGQDGGCTITGNSDFAGPCCSRSGDGLYCQVLPGRSTGVCTQTLNEGDKCAANTQCYNDECYNALVTDQFGDYSTCAGEESSSA